MEDTEEKSKDSALKIRYHAGRDGTSRYFSPANLEVEFNGAPVEFCQGVWIEIHGVDPPLATLSFTLTDLDVDMDTLIWLQAYIKARESADSKTPSPEGGS